MRLHVRVVPNAKKVRIEETEAELKVWVDAPARDGKANKRLIEILSKHYGAKKAAIKIISGEKGREKIIEVPDDVTNRQ